MSTITLDKKKTRSLGFERNKKTRREKKEYCPIYKTRRGREMCSGPLKELGFKYYKYIYPTWDARRTVQVFSKNVFFKNTHQQGLSFTTLDKACLLLPSHAVSPSWPGVVAIPHAHSLHHGCCKDTLARGTTAVPSPASAQKCGEAGPVRGTSQGRSDKQAEDSTAESRQGSSPF